MRVSSRSAESGAKDNDKGRDKEKDKDEYNKQGNYSLRRPPKLIIPQAVIRH